jgi:signal transduction histidine kinase/ActR/RegA family two-component response regulator
VSAEDGSLGEIRNALAGITRRLDALADAVGIAAANAPPGALLDEPTRARLAGLRSLLAIGRGTSRSEACLLAIDRALTHARADCAAILQLSGERSLTVLAQQGFRLPLEPRADDGIVGRAIHADEVVQAGPGLGAPDALLDQHGLGAALAIPIHAASGRPAGAFLAGRRRPVPFDADAIGTLIVAGDRLGAALLGESEGAGEPATPTGLFASLDPARTAAVVASETATRLGAQAVAVFLPDGDGFVLAGGAGLPDDARAPSSTVALGAVTGTRRAFVPAEGVPADPALARCLGTPLRAVLPLAVDEWLVALLAVGNAGSCGTALSPSFEHAAALALRNARLHAESLRTVADAATDAAPQPVAAGDDSGSAPLGDMASLLAVVLGRLASVRDQVGDSAAARDLAHAEEAAWRVAEGVRRVLGHAPRSGAHPAAPVDIGAAVRDSVRATERLWANEGSVPSVTLDLDPVPPVRVHPEELRQALHHLLQNAREAGNDAGSVAISLRWNGATHIELSVADRGRGMDEATRTRADEPFFTTKGPGRLGVGLAVVRTMASRHRGELEIESVPGQGTTVRLRLPAAAGTRIGPGRPEPGARASRRILVVDDDEAVRESLVQGLMREGYVVRAASDVGEAVALLGREPVDLVVTDLVLPGGSGLEVARAAKRGRPGAAVVLITGWPGRVAAETLEAHGVDAVVEKPVGLETLRATVATLIERASSRRQ